ncbi:MAG: ABC transporter permease [Acidobacteriota bacterium]|nr:ABC transporter permease [Acidobacteriota bacterium]
MKFLEIFRFEFTYQIRQVSTWLYFAVLAAIAFLVIRGNHIFDAREGYFLLDSPYAIASTIVIVGLKWLLIAAPVAGDSAARDVQTRMYPLIYTSPISKFDYLGGRFLASFVINALILLGVPAGILIATYLPGIAMYLPGVEPEILGSFRAASYLSAYAVIALPNAFFVTTLQFSLSALNRRAGISYLGGVTLLLAGYIGTPVLLLIAPIELASLLDPTGVIGILELPEAWTPIEMNARLIALEGSFLLNRLLWIGIGLGLLVFTYLRFQFAQPLTSTFWSRLTRWRQSKRFSAIADTGITGNTSISIPQIRRNFDLAARARQTSAIAWDSFRTIAKRPSGIFLLTIFALLTVLLIPLNAKHLGVPFFPTTEYVLTFLTVPLTDPKTFWIIIPLLIIYYAGELIWREREAGLSEIADAAPVPEWILLLGKFLGLSLILVVWMALLAIAGVLAQASMNYQDFEIGLYLKILFGLQLPEYLLFACLVFALHILVNQKHLGHLATLAAYGLIAFAPVLGIEHHLLVYSSAPNWSYTDMRGFGSSLEPWLWFKLYWTAWALLLAVMAKLFWVRSKESSFKSRFQLARSRFSGATAGIGAAALLFIILAGSFIFYNTNILNEYQTASAIMERRAEYERRYGQYENIPQPRIINTNLHVEIYPERRTADIRGTYRLVNRSAATIDSLHLATAPEVETGEISFDRPATLTFADKELNHQIYTLNEPLQPGDSMNLNFEVHYKSQGFRNSGAEFAVTANGSYFKNQDWLPAIGYQRTREINAAAERRLHDLPARPAFPTLDDVEARGLWADADRIAFEAVIGTDENQTAVAPGTLRRTWTENNRRYFEYAVNAPIENEYSFFSAEYAVREARWNDVAIQIFHHPAHTANLDRILQGAQASLDYYTRHFGPYPNDYIRFVERPGEGLGMHSDTTTIDYSEGSSRFNPGNDPRGLDFISAVVAHEVGHQWWGGSQLTPAYVEGAPLLTESLAWYTAMGVMDEGYGSEQQRRLVSFMQETYETPRTPAAVPLLRAASDWFLAYRKGPLALYALSKYIGKERINLALRRLFEKHGSGEPPLPTSLDLYRELQAVTPDSHQYLLHDLLAANTFWELETEEAQAQQTESGEWQVTLDVRARKAVVDSAGVESILPMDDWVEIGVFAPNEDDKKLGEPLYLQMHRLVSGQQTITVTVPKKPARAGIDPSQLLIDLKMRDNVKKVKLGS